MLESPLFQPLHPVVSRLGGNSFPSLAACNELLSECSRAIRVGSGEPLRFVAQEHGKLPFARQYEPRCYLTGEVQTREDNWHDLFNALVWLTFPAAKAAINARHYQSLKEGSAAEDDSKGGRSQRGGVRDMLTLLDESGVLVVCAEPELESLLRDFRWTELFWQKRERVRSAMGFYLFGHGLYEKALRPYLGMTGQGLVLPVEPDFFAWPLQRRLPWLDGLLADYLSAPGNCRGSRELTPVPLLGVPGWTPENDAVSYYENNASYFRAGRLSLKI
jgi:hypothetical protein